jgi:hypothetical protein
MVSAIMRKRASLSWSATASRSAASVRARSVVVARARLMAFFARSVAVSVSCRSAKVGDFGSL